jgi:hypothetical protein
VELALLMGGVVGITFIKDVINHVVDKGEKEHERQYERTLTPPPIGERSKEAVEILPNDIPRRDPPIGDMKEVTLAAKHEKNQERLGEQMAEIQDKFDKKHPDKESPKTMEMQKELDKQFDALIKHQAKEQELERQRLHEDPSGKIYQQ